MNQGTGIISGGVFTEFWVAGLPGWCVELTGSVASSALTGPAGLYRFSGLPDGDYMICVTPLSGWEQAFPRAGMGVSCPSGIGYQFSIFAPANVAGDNDFTYRQ